LLVVAVIGHDVEHRPDMRDGEYRQSAGGPA
jgi:hypothetical protein